MVSTMHPSVQSAWPAFVTTYEGRCSWLYLDTKKLPTTGLGFRVVDVDAMLALPWVMADTGSPATPSQIRAEWTRINASTALAPRGGYAFESVARLRISDTIIDQLLLTTTDAFWSVLLETVPQLETWPADAQLALLDMAWNMGPRFFPGWPNFTKAAQVADFTGCALHCIGVANSPREHKHRELFTTAAAAVLVGADPAVLWNGEEPRPPVIIAPPPPLPPPPASTDETPAGAWTRDGIEAPDGTEKATDPYWTAGSYLRAIFARADEIVRLLREISAHVR